MGPCGLQLAHDSKCCVMVPVVISHGLGGVRKFRRETKFSAFRIISGKICSRRYQLSGDLVRVFKKCFMQISHLGILAGGTYSYFVMLICLFSSF